ncbi:MAG: glycosyltransferase family 39 protein [Bacteroidales bacterium]|nr:glycosyltransferase family 39 protein [Bacteroidales bacterium]
MGKDGTGKTVSDFPLIYFGIAKIWHIFGYNVFIYRLVILLFFFSGLFALFKYFENSLKDSILAIICSLFLFTSPTLVYYANNFLMDIPAFSLALIGLYFFLKFCQSSSNKHLYIFALCYALGGLLKISSLLSYMAILGIFFLELINIKFIKDRKIFQHPLKQAIPLISVLIIQFVWYTYASNYNEKYNEGIFLIGILPIWDMSLSQIKETLNAIVSHIKWDYFRRETQLVFVLMFIMIMVFFKRIDKKMLALVILNSLGFLFFIILFFQALEGHEYYTINLFILVPVVLLSFLLLLKDRYRIIYNSIFFKIILIAFLVHNVDFARRRMESRYKQDGWSNKYYFSNYQSLTEVTPYLRSIGLEEDDKVLSLSDRSINISLYLMNQKGWTNYGIHSDSLKIEKKINLGAEYLFIFDKGTYKDSGINSFIHNKIGEYKNIDIYAL